MKIACLQFAPQVGDIDHNLNRADAVLSKANPEGLDLLVLPEMAFSGYNFRSLQHITPYLEPTGAGITSLWARCKALKYNCIVSAGYPEKVDVAERWPASPEYYNSTITANADGETIANYRKSHLYYTDETWALESERGFYGGYVEGLGNVAIGICTDLNPYQSMSPWSAWEFSHHVLHVHANLVILSMAWLTREDPRAFSRVPREPDMDSLSYWLARLEPIIRAEAVGEIVIVIANRCGSEEEAVYAGSSAVIGINDGEVKVYGIIGRGERDLLVVDTSNPPQAKLISTPFVGSGISIASNSDGCDSSPFHSGLATVPGSGEEFAERNPFRTPTTPMVEKGSFRDLFESGPSRANIKKSPLLEVNTGASIGKPNLQLSRTPETNIAQVVSAEILNKEPHGKLHNQKERIEIGMNVKYEDFATASPAVARIAPEYFDPQLNGAVAASQDSLRSTSGKSGLLTPSPDMVTFKRKDLLAIYPPQRNVETRHDWANDRDSIRLDVNDTFSPISPTDERIPPAFFGLGLSTLHREVVRNKMLTNNEANELATTFAGMSSVLPATHQDPANHWSPSRTRRHLERTDEHYLKKLENITPPPQSSIPQEPRFGSIIRQISRTSVNDDSSNEFRNASQHSGDSIASRRSAQSSNTSHQSRATTPHGDLNSDILQSVTVKYRLLPETPEAAVIAAIERPPSTKSRNSSLARAESRHRGRSPASSFGDDNVASAVETNESANSCHTSRTRRQSRRRESKHRGRSPVTFIGQDTHLSSHGESKFDRMKAAVQPAKPKMVSIGTQTDAFAPQPKLFIAPTWGIQYSLVPLSPSPTATNTRRASEFPSPSPMTTVGVPNPIYQAWLAKAARSVDKQTLRRRGSSNW